MIKIIFVSWALQFCLWAVDSMVHDSTFERWLGVLGRMPIKGGRTVFTKGNNTISKYFNKITWLFPI